MLNPVSAVVAIVVMVVILIRQRSDGDESPPKKLARPPSPAPSRAEPYAPTQSRVQAPPKRPYPLISRSEDPYDIEDRNSRNRSMVQKVLMKDVGVQSMEEPREPKSNFEPHHLAHTHHSHSSNDFQDLNKFFKIYEEIKSQVSAKPRKKKFGRTREEVEKPAEQDLVSNNSNVPSRAFQATLSMKDIIKRQNENAKRAIENKNLNKGKNESESEKEQNGFISDKKPPIIVSSEQKAPNNQKQELSFSSLFNTKTPDPSKKVAQNEATPKPAELKPIEPRPVEIKPFEQKITAPKTNPTEQNADENKNVSSLNKSAAPDVEFFKPKSDDPFKKKLVFDDQKVSTPPSTPFNLNLQTPIQAQKADDPPKNELTFQKPANLISAFPKTMIELPSNDLEDEEKKKVPEAPISPFTTLKANPDGPKDTPVFPFDIPKGNDLFKKADEGKLKSAVTLPPKLDEAKPLFPNSTPLFPYSTSKPSDAPLFPITSSNPFEEIKKTPELSKTTSTNPFAPPGKPDPLESFKVKDMSTIKTGGNSGFFQTNENIITDVHDTKPISPMIPPVTQTPKPLFNQPPQNAPFASNPAPLFPVNTTPSQNPFAPQQNPFLEIKKEESLGVSKLLNTTTDAQSNPFIRNVDKSPSALFAFG